FAAHVGLNGVVLGLRDRDEGVGAGQRRVGAVGQLLQHLVAALVDDLELAGGVDPAAGRAADRGLLEVLLVRQPRRDPDADAGRHLAGRRRHVALLARRRLVGGETAVLEFAL